MSPTAVSPSDVKRLRDETGAGMLESKKAGRETSKGIVASYVHHGGRVGVLVEVKCETDFVARTDAFQEMSRAVAMQIAVARPRWTRREDVPAEILAHEKEMVAGEIAAQIKGKPPEIVERIVEGKMKRFFVENCLLDQEFLISPASDASTVQEYIAEVVAKVGENIVVGRFSRIEVGEA